MCMEGRKAFAGSLHVGVTDINEPAVTTSLAQATAGSCCYLPRCGRIWEEQGVLFVYFWVLGGWERKDVFAVVC